MSVGLQKFEILLDSPDHTFSPGEIIVGRVLVDLNRPKSIRGLKVRGKGRGEVKWSESTGSGKDRKTEYLTAEEEYFRTEFFVLGQSGHSENVEIPAGSHVFPFNICLPRNIPSSFETKHANIRYTIKAVMDRPWKFDHETTITFNVETPYDLSQCRSAMTAIDDEDYTTFCCFSCLNVGAMKVNIFLPSGGFTIGEAIKAKITINNTSTSVDVTKVKLRLEQKIKLYARFPRPKTKSDSNVVQSIKKAGPFSKNDEIIVSMQVPSLPYSDLVHCSIIDITYNLRVIIGVSGCHCNPEKSYPIVIGSKPASSVQSVQNPNMISGPMPSAPVFPAESPTPMGLMPMPYPTSHGEQFPGTSRDELNAPALGFSNPPPTYGFVPVNNPPYPQAMPGPVGFVTPYPPQISSSVSTEKPPPSYSEAMASSGKH